MRVSELLPGVTSLSHFFVLHIEIIRLLHQVLVIVYDVVELAVLLKVKLLREELLLFELDHVQTESDPFRVGDQHAFVVVQHEPPQSIHDCFLNLLFGLTVGDYHMNSLDDAVELWSLLFPLRQISELEILLQVIHYLILVSLKVLELVIDRVYLKELIKLLKLDILKFSLHELRLALGLECGEILARVKRN